MRPFEYSVRAQWEKEITQAENRLREGLGIAGARAFPEADRPGDGSVNVDSAPHRQEGAGLQEDSLEGAQAVIATVCDELKEFLLAKNRSYGNSAFEPIGVFSKLTAREGILLRMDDKLKRIRNGTAYPGDDNMKDLLGYMVLLAVYDRMEAK